MDLAGVQGYENDGVQNLTQLREKIGAPLQQLHVSPDVGKQIY